MKLHRELTIPLPIGQAWEGLSNLERLSPYLPGTNLAQRADGTVIGDTDLQVGPLRLRATGTGEFIEKDPVNHRATLAGHTVNGDGQRTAEGTVRVTMHALDDAQTQVVLDGDIRLTAAGLSAGIRQATGDRKIVTPPGMFAAGGMRLQSRESHNPSEPSPSEPGPTRPRPSPAPAAASNAPAAPRTGARWLGALRQQVKDPKVAGGVGVAVGVLATMAARRRR